MVPPAFSYILSIWVPGAGAGMVGFGGSACENCGSGVSAIGTARVTGPLSTGVSSPRPFFVLSSHLIRRDDSPQAPSWSLVSLFSWSPSTTFVSGDYESTEHCALGALDCTYPNHVVPRYVPSFRPWRFRNCIIAPPACRFLPQISLLSSWPCVRTSAYNLSPRQIALPLAVSVPD